MSSNTGDCKFSAGAAPLLHCCDCPAGKVPTTPLRRHACTTVDFHCHVLVPSVETLVAGHVGKEQENRAIAETMGQRSMQVNAQQLGELVPKLTDISMRLRDMQNMGVDVQVLSPSPTQYYYWAERELAATIVNEINTSIGGLCQQYPGQFRGLGTVALQHPELAGQQLARAVGELGLVGVEIGAQVAGRNIADPAFDPFWAEAEQTRALVFLHPWNTTIGSRLDQFYLGNTIGQPLETTIALTNMVYAGTFDRFPGIRVLAAHGGGYLPLNIGRANHAYEARPEAQGCHEKPSSYLSRIWYDSLVHDPRQLNRLIEDVGWSQVVLGTDYPFDMGHYDPHGIVATYDEVQRRGVLGENALRLLGELDG